MPNKFVILKNLMNFINKKNLANICGMLVWFHNKTELFQHLSTTTFNGEQAKYAKTGFRCCLLSLCHSLLFFPELLVCCMSPLHIPFFFQPYQPFFFNLTNFTTLRVLGVPFTDLPSNPLHPSYTG